MRKTSVGWIVVGALCIGACEVDSRTLSVADGEQESAASLPGQDQERVGAVSTAECVATGNPYTRGAGLVEYRSAPGEWASAYGDLGFETRLEQ